jgi:enamine deaminase RidA (YjgF/YER057c/UK114 family)
MAASSSSRGDLVKEQRNPASIHAPLAGYAHQIELRGEERLLVVSGQVGMTPDGELPDDPAEQLALAMDNVVRNLEAADMGVADLVKLTFYHVDPIDPVRRREIVDARLGGHTPCMTLIYVAGLARPEINLEVDAWASA